MLRNRVKNKFLSIQYVRENSTIEEEEHEIVGPTSKCPLYKVPEGQQEHEHKILGPVYLRPHLRASYDVNVVKDIIHVSKRFENLKPELVFQLLGERSRYDFLKKFAIYRLEEKLTQQLAIFSKTMNYNDSENIASDELSHRIFSWNWDDFQTRRLLTNFVWVDILLRTEEKCLHIYKFQQDLQQLQQFIKKIFKVLNSNMDNEEFNIYYDIEKPIDEARKVLHTMDNVEEQLHFNTSELKQLRRKEYFLIDARRDSEAKFVKYYLENRIWNSHIWDPIEIRYSLNWYQNMVEQNQFRANNTLQKCRSDIDKSNRQTHLESFYDDNCMDFFYSTTEMYKTRISEMEEKFERDVEIMDNKLTYKRIQIDKLKEQRKWLTGEIERFHEEEEMLRIRLLREEEESELKRMKEEEEKAAAKVLIEQKKSRKPKATAVKSATPKLVGNKAKEKKRN